MTSLAELPALAAYPRPNQTDLGNAMRFVGRYGSRVRYVPAWKAWLVYDGRRWARDVEGEVHRLAWDTVLAIYDEVKAEPDKTEREALLAHAKRSQGEARLDAMLAIATRHPDLVVRHEQLDVDPLALNVLNGTIGLRTGVLQPHHPADLITRLIPIAYLPSASHAAWERFLCRIMEGNNGMVAFLQRAVGYSLTGATREDVFFFLHGGGGNGKSTFIDTVRTVLAEYAQEASIETFLVRHNPSSTSGDLARMEGIRLVKASEPAKGRQWDETRIKEMTGGEQVTACYKYAEPFEFRPQCKLWFAANTKPRLLDTSRAMQRRLRLIPFRVTISEADQDFDQDLDAKLLAEREGILAWAVAGCLAWQATGLGIPPDVTRASAEYLTEADTVGQFLSDCCVEDHTAWVGGAALYARYGAWARANNDEVLAPKNFGEEAAAKLEKDRKGPRSTVRYRGIRFLTSTEEAAHEAERTCDGPTIGGTEGSGGSTYKPLTCARGWDGLPDSPSTTLRASDGNGVLLHEDDFYALEERAGMAGDGA